MERGEGLRDIESSLWSWLRDTRRGCVDRCSAARDVHLLQPLNGRVVKRGVRFGLVNTLVTANFLTG